MQQQPDGLKLEDYLIRLSRSALADRCSGLPRLPIGALTSYNPPTNGCTFCLLLTS